LETSLFLNRHCIIFFINKSSSFCRFISPIDFFKLALYHLLYCIVTLVSTLLLSTTNVRTWFLLNCENFIADFFISLVVNSTSILFVALHMSIWKSVTSLCLHHGIHIQSLVTIRLSTQRSVFPISHSLTVCRSSSHYLNREWCKHADGSSSWWGTTRTGPDWVSSIRLMSSADWGAGLTHHPPSTTGGSFCEFWRIVIANSFVLRFLGGDTLATSICELLCLPCHLLHFVYFNQLDMATLIILN
jgi:hypothetical protein